MSEEVLRIGTVRHDGERPQIWFKGQPLFSLEDDEPDDRVKAFCEYLLSLRAECDQCINLLRGYRKMVTAVTPYFDKPLTDENMVHWLNLNNAGATVDIFLSKIDAALRASQEKGGT